MIEKDKAMRDWSNFGSRHCTWKRKEGFMYMYDWTCFKKVDWLADSRRVP